MCTRDGFAPRTRLGVAVEGHFRLGRDPHSIHVRPMDQTDKCSFVYPSIMCILLSGVGRSPCEDAREDLEEEAAEDDEAEENYGFPKLVDVAFAWVMADVLNQMGEMGDLGASLTRFLI